MSDEAESRWWRRFRRCVQEMPESMEVVVGNNSKLSAAARGASWTHYVENKNMDGAPPLPLESFRPDGVENQIEFRRAYYETVGKPKTAAAEPRRGRPAAGHRHQQRRGPERLRHIGRGRRLERKPVYVIKPMTPEQLVAWDNFVLTEAILEAGL